MSVEVEFHLSTFSYEFDFAKVEFHLGDLELGVQRSLKRFLLISNFSHA